MQVKLRRKKKAEIPTIKLPMKTKKLVASAVEGGIIDNIISQKQADGSPLKRNQKKTRDRKAKAGRPGLSLVDKMRRFVKGRKQSWDFKTTTKGVIIKAATSELRNLMRYVQENGYVGWFGISEKARAAIKAAVRKEIREAFDRAAK